MPALRKCFFLVCSLLTTAWPWVLKPRATPIHPLKGFPLDLAARVLGTPVIHHTRSIIPPLLVDTLQPLAVQSLTPVFASTPETISRGVSGAANVGRRSLRVANVMFSVASFVYRWRSAKKLYPKDQTAASRQHNRIAKDMKNKFVALGPTYVKLGQLLSTRPDLISREYVEAFRELQDRVPPFPGEAAVAVVERELGGRIGDFFSKFNTTPMAAASIGQVHLAETAGVPVAVKVQRPGVKELFDMDLDILRVLVGFLDSFYSNIDGVRCDWKGLFDEYSKIMYQELDYRREALQGIRFKTNFANIPWVAVPEVIMNLSSSRVLSMQYLPGIKISDVAAIEKAGLDRKLLSSRLAQSYLLQLCKHGFFHCDPHAGNLACDRGHPGGRLIYYDFGMMGVLPADIRKNFVALILAMYENDVQAAYDAFYNIGVIDTEADQNDIKKVLTLFLDEFNSLVYTASGIYTSQLSKDEQDLLVRKRRLKLGADLWMKLQDEGLFKLPSTFTFISRAFNILDGVGKALDPRYDLFKLAQPFVSELVQSEAGISNREIQFWRSSVGRFLLKLGIKRASPNKVKVDSLPSIDSVQYQDDREDMKRMVLKNRLNLHRLLLQQSNLMNAAQLSVLLGFLRFGDGVSRGGGDTSRWGSALRKLQWAAQRATLVVSVSKLFWGVVQSNFALKKMEVES